MHYILVLDEGTTSTRAMLFAPDGTCIDRAQQALTQYYPLPGYVEHDAEQIWSLTLECARAVVQRAGGARTILALGITNQRETVVFWDKRTGLPLAPAIVWQDRRTADAYDALKAAGHEPVVQAKTGLLLDPYFSGAKIGWALAHWPALRAAGRHLAVGTVDSYLAFRLTGGQHVTDATNASRTALMALGSSGWDDGLLDLFGVPRRILPEILDSAGSLGTTSAECFGAPIALCGIAGDQQAAAIGQGCLRAGLTKATFGTGAFILTQTGRSLPQSKHKLLSTIAWQLGGERHYALEGSVFTAGSLIRWMRDDLGLIQRPEETDTLARSVPDNGGVYIVPALSGLGAPHWRPDARGSIVGLHFAARKAHVARAALEAMAHQAHDLKLAFAADGAEWTEVRIDGGMVANDWMAQDLADVLDVVVERPRFIETTALGAAMLAAVGAGVYSTLQEAASMRGPVQRFTPALDSGLRSTRLIGWQRAVDQTLSVSLNG